MRRLLALVMVMMLPCLVSCGSKEGGLFQQQATEVSMELWYSEENAETEQYEGVEETESEPVPEKERPAVKGIYVTGPVAGSERMNDLITLVDATQLNTMVIDVKNDDGEITWKMETDSVREMGNGVAYIRDIHSLMDTLKEHGIYTIARIVCFKDPVFAQNHIDCALRKPDGGFVTDAYGLAWVNPYNEEVWAYLTEIAQAALDVGFDEVQFDYVRFPIGSDADAADYKVDMTVNTKEQAISGFLSYTSERLHEKGGVVTADVFGTVIDSSTDIERVGQNYAELGKKVDVLSPMVYPSHYGPGVFGFDVPDAHPYDTVYQALMLSQKVLGQNTGEECAIVRPWLQAFTATWVSGHISYEGEQIQEQIRAVYDAGYEEWILWNATCRYPMDFSSAEQAEESLSSL
ncbi:MAG: putative glycoside hydrolase [Lachnospiraceae bacterium]|nr:putative glycoside hydrolase [Lachnospiraceae bacterium]